MTRFRGALLALLLALAAVFATTASASAAPCALAWGTGAKTSAALGTGPITGVRTGVHPCYDRVVFAVNGHAGGYTVQYVRTVTAEGSGAALYVPGGARLMVSLHNPAGRLPYLVNQKVTSVAGYPVLRSITYGGSFEGYTTYGVGVKAKAPFRVFILRGTPDRVVVDIART